MSRIFDFTVLTVVYIISAIIHLIGAELFTPNGILYSLATDGTGAMNGQALADQWFMILTVWVPLISVGGMTAYVIIREYRRQTVTAVQTRGF